MGSGIHVEAVRPGDLDAEAQGRWRAFRAARPELASPYFDLRYVQAAGEAVPHAAVAVAWRGGRIEAFLPFQRRGGLIQPLGAPLCDYHGLVAAPGSDIAVADLFAVAGRSLRVSGWVGEAPAQGMHARRAMVADLGRGFEAYLGQRKAAGQGAALKDKRRRARALERDHGAVEFSFGADPGDVLDFIVRFKRAQMRRTGQHDVFANAWTRRLLARLSGAPDADFGLRFAVLKARGQVIAAEAGLLSGDAYHLWFPVYDPDFARYSPGSLMTFETLRALAAQGVRTVDFGPAEDDYKRLYADPGQPVWEGQVNTRGFAAACWRAGERLASPAPAAARAWRAAVRRIDRIAACEPTFNGQVGATARSVADLGRRHPGKTLGLALAATAPLAILAAID